MPAFAEQFSIEATRPNAAEIAALAGILPPWNIFEQPPQRPAPPPQPAADRLDNWLIDRLFRKN